MKISRLVHWQTERSAPDSAGPSAPEAYASLKFEGPAFYPEDAGKKNVVYCDRIVIVRLD